jgi:serine/threonine-protein kinase
MSVEMIGRAVSHYKVIEKLGEGGMGEVYLAEDTSLRRKVALKFLPASFADDEVAHKRLLREAQSAAALDHPFICNIHEVVQTDDGQDFIVMEYVAGQTLRERLTQGSLPLADALRVGSEISEALEEAHRNGIVHRDLKPANIMLTRDGHAKVMDFGLAKRVAAGDRTQDEITSVLTREGFTIGTLAYMSPEQLRGEPVDTRSDIFSFGILVYEMLTGAHPFRRGAQVATAAAILHEPPLPPSEHAKNMPQLLENLINEMLAKDPVHRSQHVEDVRRRLLKAGMEIERAGLSEGLRTRTVPTKVNPEKTLPSIAVLPFKDMSPQRDQDYFCEGIAEETINALAHVEKLRVVARTSAFSFKDQQTDIREIGQRLNVKTVLEGSVRKAGDRLRITAQLIDVENGFHLWSDRFDRKIDDVFAVQDEIALTITEKLKLELAADEKAALQKRYTDDPEAYEAYLKGQSHFYKLTPEDLETALQYFEVALEKDPDYALAHVGVALVWIGRRQLGGAPPVEAGPKVKAAVSRALELDNTLAEAHYALALDKTWGQWDWEAAEKAFQRALELNPNYPDARVYYSNLLCSLGRIEEAMAQAVRATELDPLNSLFQCIHGSALVYMRQYDDAQVRFRRALRTSPNDPVAHSGLWDTFHLKKEYDEALEAAKSTLAAFGRPDVAEVLAQGYQKSGYREAMHLAAETLAELARETCVLSFFVGVMFTCAEQKEQALDWLEKAYETGDPMMPYLNSPMLDILGDEPRFHDLLRRMNFPEDVLAGYLNKTQ